MSVSLNKMPKKRNFHILMNYERVIDLQTKVVKDKTKYTRKQKHKSDRALMRYLGYLSA